MKVSLSSLKMKKDGNNKDVASLLSEWIGPQTSKEQAQVEDYGKTKGAELGDNRPIEPKIKLGFKGQSIIKWISLSCSSLIWLSLITACPS